MWEHLQFLRATFQPNWTLLNVSASGNSWLLIRYHVKLPFCVCLTYLICSVPNALFSLISRKQLGWSHLSAGSHWCCCNPVDFTHRAILLCRLFRGSDTTDLSCQTLDRHLIKRALLSWFSPSCLEPYHFHFTGSSGLKELLSGISPTKYNPGLMEIDKPINLNQGPLLVDLDWDLWLFYFGLRRFKWRVFKHCPLQCYKVVIFISMKMFNCLENRCLNHCNGASNQRAVIKALDSLWSSLWSVLWINVKTHHKMQGLCQRCFEKNLMKWGCQEIRWCRR